MTRDRTQWRSVSVIVPAYNCAHLLERCLKSILEQTYPVAEIVLIDDGSTDETPVLLAGLSRLDEYRDRLRWVRLEENVGPSESRNVGLRLAKSEFVAFIDSDDYWLPQHIATALEILEREGPDISVVVHQPLVDGCPRPSETILRYRAFSLLYYLFVQANCSTITLVASRQLVLKTPLFPAGRHFAEDFEFFIRLFHLSEKRLCVLAPRTAVMGKHAYASGAGLSSRLFRMYTGSLVSLGRGLRFTPYRWTVPMLWAWHTVKLFRRCLIAYRQRLGSK